MCDGEQLPVYAIEPCEQGQRKPFCTRIVRPVSAPFPMLAHSRDTSLGTGEERGEHGLTHARPEWALVSALSRPGDHIAVRNDRHSVGENHITHLTYDFGLLPSMRA